MSGTKPLSVAPIGDLTKFARLYRYLPWSRLRQMLESNEYEFRSPFTWEDRTEWLWTNLVHKTFGGGIYCTCWTRNYTSEAPWRIYRNNDKKDPLVRISTTLHRLQNSFSDDSKHITSAHLLNVEYVQDKTLETVFQQVRESVSRPTDVLEALRYKRYPYRWEKESRLVVNTLINHGEKFHISCDFSKLLTGVLISPHAQGSVSRDIKSQMLKLGFKDVTKQSLLLSLPRTLRGYAKKPPLR